MPQQITVITETDPTTRPVQAPVRCRVHTGWSDAEAIAAYLDGLRAEELPDRYRVAFHRMEVWSDIGDAQSLEEWVWHADCQEWVRSV